MSKTKSANDQGFVARIAGNTHAAIIGACGAGLTATSFYFNGSFGYEQGGIAMSAAFLAFAGLKDGAISYAATPGVRARGIAAAVGAIGFTLSCVAAIGAASHGRQSAADPKAQQISAYQSAVKQERTLEEQIAALGKVLSKADADAALARVQVDAGIFKRTAHCTKTDHDTKRIAAVNVEACRPYLVAQAMVAKAVEANELHAKLEEVRGVIAKGRPASADAQASSIARILKLDAVDGIQAWMNIILALSIEIAAPLAWAVMARSAARGEARTAPAQVPVPAQTPVLTVVRSAGRRVGDDEAEAIILADLARGLDHGQEHYALQFGVSIATVSRMIDRLVTKPNAKLKEQKVGTRRKLIAA